VAVLSNQTIDHSETASIWRSSRIPLPLAEASLMTTKLGTTDYGLYAAPEYLERKGFRRATSTSPASTCSPGAPSTSRRNGC
jgi:hypothetical protein